MKYPKIIYLCCIILQLAGCAKVTKIVDTNPNRVEYLESMQTQYSTFDTKVLTTHLTDRHIVVNGEYSLADASEIICSVINYYFEDEGYLYYFGELLDQDDILENTIIVYTPNYNLALLSYYTLYPDDPEKVRLNGYEHWELSCWSNEDDDIVFKSDITIKDDLILSYYSGEEFNLEEFIKEREFGVRK